MKEKKTITKRLKNQVLTSGLDLKLKITFVLVQRSVGQAASGSTYPSAALYNDNICACKTKQGSILLSTYKMHFLDHMIPVKQLKRLLHY